MLTFCPALSGELPAIVWWFSLISIGAGFGSDRIIPITIKTADITHIAVRNGFSAGIMSSSGARDDLCVNGASPRNDQRPCPVNPRMKILYEDKTKK